MINDPAVWGPVLVAVAVLYAGHRIERIIHLANLDRIGTHRETMEILEVVRGDIDGIDTKLAFIENNTTPPVNPADYD